MFVLDLFRFPGMGQGHSQYARIDVMGQSKTDGHFKYVTSSC